MVKSKDAARVAEASKPFVAENGKPAPNASGAASPNKAVKTEERKGSVSPTKSAGSKSPEKSPAKGADIKALQAQIDNAKARL